MVSMGGACGTGALGWSRAATVYASQSQLCRPAALGSVHDSHKSNLSRPRPVLLGERRLRHYARRWWRARPGTSKR